MPSWTVNLETPFSKVVPGRDLASEKRPKGKSLFQDKGFASRVELLFMKWKKKKKDLTSENKEEKQNMNFFFTSRVDSKTASLIWDPK